MTGHADGMVRFVGENTAIVNAPLSPYGFETKVKKSLQNYGFNVIDFPYFYSKGDSAVGCYLNYLETEKSIFLPVFGVDTDNEAINKAKTFLIKQLFRLISTKLPNTAVYLTVSVGKIKSRQI